MFHVAKIYHDFCEVRRNLRCTPPQHESADSRGTVTVTGPMVCKSFRSHFWDPP